MSLEMSAFFAVVLLTFFFVLGLWAIDTGASAALCGCKVEGLFFSREPVVQYHIGMVLSVFSFLCMVVLLLVVDKKK